MISFASLCLLLLAPSAPVQLSGTVHDRAGTLLRDAVVGLQGAGLLDTSDQQGLWSLSGMASAVVADHRFAARLQGDQLVLDLAHPSRVEVEIFDARGTRLGRPTSLMLAAGIQNFRLPATSAKGLAWARVRIDGFSRTFAYLAGSASGFRSAPASRAVLAARTAGLAPDTLVAWWKGQILAKLPLDSLQGTGIDLVLDTTLSLPYNPAIQYGSVFDPASNRLYRTVKIGTHVWMAENFAAPVAGSWVPRFDSSGVLGRLYTWAAALALPDTCSAGLCGDRLGSQPRGICPQDWHVPSGNEWYALVVAAGGDSASSNDLRATRGWPRPGTDRWGFRALPSGMRPSDSSLADIGQAQWWASTESDLDHAQTRWIADMMSFATSDLKSQPHSLRCLADTLEVALRDTLVEIGTSLRLRGAVRGLAGAPLQRVEWSVDGGPFREGGLDTTIQIPPTARLQMLVLARVTDANGVVSSPDTAMVRALHFLTDERDGKRYPIVKIGTQTWMAANLDRETPKSWWYQNSATAGQRYGRLYTWSSSMDLPDSCDTVACSYLEPRQGACPQGWHVPSYDNWLQLVNFAGGSTHASAPLSAPGWPQFADQPGIDSLGFHALPGGYRNTNGTYGSLSAAGMWWSSTKSGTKAAFNWQIGNAYLLLNTPSLKTNGSSLRCQEDPISMQLSDTAVEPGSSVRLHARTTGLSTRDSLRWQWSIDGGAWTTGTSDTTLVATFSRPGILVGVQVIDPGGNSLAARYVTVRSLPTFVDARDGKRYAYVKLGNATWMADNLDYADSASHKFFGTSDSSAAGYGRYYTWSRAMRLPAKCDTTMCANLAPHPVQGVCPAEWHIPSDTEWIALHNFAKGTGTGVDSSATRLKSAHGWYVYPPTVAGTDVWGFHAVPSGIWAAPDQYFRLKFETEWTTSAEYDAKNSRVGLIQTYTMALESWSLKTLGMSVRCVRNLP